MPSVLNAGTFNDGDAGSLTINTSNLVLRDGGRVDTSTVGTGNAGSLNINASKYVEVSGTVPESLNPSQIDSSASKVDESLRQFLKVQPLPTGNSGDLSINTPVLRVTDGGLVNVKNDGPGNAGKLRINADSIFLNNSGSITAATALGKNGEITIQVENLQLRNNSAITATAGGNSQGGDITIEAKNIQLRNNSDINATANGDGNGGDITIITDTLVGLEDSDIMANTISGQGGEIQINAQGIFGIEPRRELTPESDITADSGVGIDGSIEINTLDFDARNSLTPLASNFVSTEEAVAGSCLARRNSQQGSFVVTGNGGLPTDPYSEIAEWETLTRVEPEISNNVSELRSQPTSSQLSSQSAKKNYTTNWKPGDPIIEAQGIVVTEDGRTLLGMKSQQDTVADPETLVCAAASPES